MAEPPVIDMTVPKEGSAFGLRLNELDSWFAELYGGGGSISRIGCDCWMVCIA
jgi:hypothetical protein